MGRITVNGKAVQFGAKVEIKPYYWNVKLGKATGKTPGIKEVNTVIESIKATITKYTMTCKKRKYMLLLIK